MTALRLAAALVPMVSVAFGARSPVGTWTGRLHLDMSKMTAQQKKQAGTYSDSMAKMRVSVTFKANHTFSATVMNALSPSDRQRNGTWSIEGDKVTLQDASMQDAPGQTFTMSKDGRTMRFHLPSRSQGNSELVLTR